MSTKLKPHTIQELVETIYEANYDHFDFIENMASGDCGCHLHMVMNTIMLYWEE
jgi:hypothetical protein